MFQCPRGLGDFSHQPEGHKRKPHPNRIEFQCPRGLGDFSHRSSPRIGGRLTPLCFNAREGLVTFPTSLRVLRTPMEVLVRFNAREGLVTFPTALLFGWITQLFM